jgi:hypothetical protein
MADKACDDRSKLPCLQAWVYPLVTPPETARGRRARPEVRGSVEASHSHHDITRILFEDIDRYNMNNVAYDTYTSTAFIRLAHQRAPITSRYAAHRAGRLPTPYATRPLPLPRLGAEDFSFPNDFPDGSTSTVHGPFDDGRAPVIGHGAARELDTEEQDDGAEGEADVKTRRDDVVVLHPPAEVLRADVLVEDVAEQAPGELHRS